MRKQPITTGPLDEEPRTDRDRLILADQALELAESNLRSLGHDKDQLAYLTEVLRVGIREALYEMGETAGADAAVVARVHH